MDRTMDRGGESNFDDLKQGPHDCGPLVYLSAGTAITIAGLEPRATIQHWKLGTSRVPKKYRESSSLSRQSLRQTGQTICAVMGHLFV